MPAWLLDSWSLWVLLASAFVIGWAAETAQTFLSRALALSILAWLQTAPEFAIEATIAWNQQTDLMIANLTGSLRLLVGLGLPLVFFVYLATEKLRGSPAPKRIRLGGEDALSVLFLFIAIVYFLVILAKRSLTVVDSAVLVGIYGVYLFLCARLPAAEEEEEADLPWVGRKIVALPPKQTKLATYGLFLVGGVALYFSAHPFVDTLQRWSVSLGISTFVFVQWVAPFLSEFPEKVTAFNWARQKDKAPMGVMNFVNSNVNQWTMLAAMIPLVFSVSRGVVTPITFDEMHMHELALTIAQSALAGLLLLDLEFSLFDAAAIFALFLVQFFKADVREEITWVYVAWIAYEAAGFGYKYVARRELPRVFVALKRLGIFGGPGAAAGGARKQ